VDIEKLVNEAHELNDTHGCGLDAAYIATAFAELTNSVYKIMERMEQRDGVGKPEPVETQKPDVPSMDDLRILLQAKVKAGKPELGKPEPVETQKPVQTETPWAVCSPPDSGVHVPSMDDLRILLQAKVKAGKKENVKTLLEEYAAARLSQIPENVYTEFKTRLEAL